MPGVNYKKLKGGLASVKEDDDDEADRDEQREIKKFLDGVSEYISMLPAGSYGRRLPYRCTVRKTAQFPEGKIGELGKMKF